MIVVGVTGNFASGKSEVARAFKALGAEVFDADVSARRLTAKGKPLHRAIVKIFGKQYLSKDGQIDRKKLGAHVFNHPTDLKKLSILIHPGVILECFDLIERRRGRAQMLVLDVPLLFESRMEELADITVVVASSRARILARAAKNGVSRELAEKILASQWPLAKKAKLADYVIANDGTRQALRTKVKKLYRQILQGPSRD